MTDDQARSVLARARLVVSRAEELLAARSTFRGDPASDSSDWYGVSLVLDAVRRLTACAKERDLTLAERVEVARTFIRRVGQRRGRPKRGEKKKPQLIAGFPWAPLRPGAETREQAARVCGLGNREGLRRAFVVVDAGLAGEVDAGRLTLLEAYRQARYASVGGQRPLASR